MRGAVTGRFAARTDGGGAVFGVTPGACALLARSRAPATPPAAPSRPYILQGCRDHAALATWLRQPCSKPPAQVVPGWLKRLPRPARRSTAPTEPSKIGRA